MRNDLMKKFFTTIVFLQVFFMNAALFAQDGEPAMPPRDQGAWQMFIVLAIGLLFFYFILWRPEQKRRKMLEQQRTSLKKGDKVTAMGIVGTVSRINDHTVVLRMIDGSKIEFLKAAITDVAPASEEDTKTIEREEKE